MYSGPWLAWLWDLVGQKPSLIKKQKTKTFQLRAQITSSVIWAHSKNKNNAKQNKIKQTKQTMLSENQQGEKNTHKKTKSKLKQKPDKQITASNLQKH